MPPLIWFLLLFATPTLAACYYPNGSISPNDTPCRDDTAESTCCGTGYACLANGMCQATGKELQKEGATELVRGACTNRSWRSSSCPLFCINPETDNMGGGIGVGRCTGTTEELYYCINVVMDQVNCRGKKNVLFFQQPASAFTTIGVVPTTPALLPTTSQSMSETTSNEPSATPSPSLVNPSRLPNQSPIVTSSASHSPTTTPNPLSPSNDRAVTIGAAVGASVGVLALGILGVWLFFAPQAEAETRKGACGSPGERSRGLLQPASTVPRSAGGLEGAGDAAAAVLDASRVTRLGRTKEMTWSYEDDMNSCHVGVTMFCIND